MTSPKKCFFLLVYLSACLFVTVHSYAQKNDFTDKLNQLNIGKANSDFSKAYTLKIINKWHDLNTNYHATIYDTLPATVWQDILTKRYNQAIKENDSGLRMQIAIPLAYVLHVQSKFELGIHVLEYLYSQLKKFDYKMQGTILIKLEEEYRSLNDMKNVIAIRNERIEKGYIKTFWEIYYSCGLYREAIEDFKLFEPMPPIATRERMGYFSRIGDLFYDAQLYDSAEKYYRIGIKEANQYIQIVANNRIKDQGYVHYWKGLFFGLVAKCMMERGLYQQALPLIRYQLLTSRENYRLAGYLSLSGCFLKLGQITNAKKYLDSTAMYLTDVTHQRAELEFLKNKSEYFQVTHQYDSSLNYLKKYNDLKEKISSAVLKNQSVFLLGRMEIEKRRKELAVTQTQLQQSIVKSTIQKNQLFISIILLIVFAGGIVLFAILYNQKQKATKEINAKNFLLEQYAQSNLNKSKHNEQLVKELHHRVKNNLQNIYSLLNIQKRRITDKESIEFVASIQNRINSMAIVHESLYADENVESVNFEQYTRTLIENIQLSFEKEHQHLQIHYAITPCTFSLEKIILLGLIINETVSNVYKYAIREDGQSEMWVRLQKWENGYQLIIKDNGPGFDEKSVKEKSLGLKLIQTMCLQLEATYRMVSENGVEHTITFNV